MPGPKKGSGANFINITFLHFHTFTFLHFYISGRVIYFKTTFPYVIQGKLHKTFIITLM